MYNNDYQIKFLAENDNGTHIHPEVELLYVMQGKIKITIQDKEYILNKDDFIIINGGHRHSWMSTSSFMLCVIYVNISIVFFVFFV